MKTKDIQELSANIGIDDEQLTGDNCPICGYPIVLECDLEVCYNCGWSKDDEDEDKQP